MNQPRTDSGGFSGGPRREPPLFADTLAFTEWLAVKLNSNSTTLARIAVQHGIRLLEDVTLALKNRQRRRRLEAVDERIIALRVLLRVMGRSKVLSEENALTGLRAVDGLGRQVGGWLKSLQRGDSLAPAQLQREGPQP